MGFTIKLETIEGLSLEEISDSDAPLEDLLPPFEDRSFVCLRFIHQYVDTVFNRLQMDDFMAELDRIRPRAKRAEQLRLLDRLQSLAQRCKDEWRLLRFYGD
jgi:hypothetical protein